MITTRHILDAETTWEFTLSAGAKPYLDTVTGRLLDSGWYIGLIAGKGRPVPSKNINPVYCTPYGFGARHDVYGTVKGCSNTGVVVGSSARALQHFMEHHKPWTGEYPKIGEVETGRPPMKERPRSRYSI